MTLLILKTFIMFIALFMTTQMILGIVLFVSTFNEKTNREINLTFQLWVSSISWSLFYMLTR